MNERYDFKTAGAALGDEVGKLVLVTLHGQTDLSKFDRRAFAAEMASYVTVGENVLRGAGATAAEAAAFGDAAVKRVSEIFAQFRATISAAKTESERGN